MVNRATLFALLGLWLLSCGGRGQHTSEVPINGSVRPHFGLPSPDGVSGLLLRLRLGTLGLFQGLLDELTDFGGDLHAGGKFDAGR